MEDKKDIRQDKSVAKDFISRNIDKIIWYVLTVLLLGGGFTKMYSKLREGIQPVDYKEIRKEVKKWRSVQEDFSESIKIMTPIINENARQIKKLTDKDKEFQEFKDDQLEFNGWVKGRISNNNSYYNKSSIFDSCDLLGWLEIINKKSIVNYE